MVYSTQNSKASSAKILLVLACFVVVAAGMRASVSILMPFLLSGFIAIISSPLLFWLRRKGLPGWLSLLVILFVIICIGLLFLWMLGSSLRNFSNDLPAYNEQFRQHIENFLAWLDTRGVETSDLNLTSILNPGRIVGFTASLFNSFKAALTNGFLILMTVLFMLLEASSLPTKLKAMMSSSDKSMKNLDKFIDNVKDYMVIKTIVSLITGIIIGIFLTILGVPYPMLWALLAFLLNFIPNIGSLIAAIPAVLIAFIQLGLLKAIIVIVGYLVVNIIMGSGIEPRFMGKTLGLSTLVVFLSLIFWGWLLGPLGMLLSVPLTMTAKIALDSREETRWLAILLGPAIPEKVTKKR